MDDEAQAILKMMESYIEDRKQAKIKDNEDRRKGKKKGTPRPVKEIEQEHVFETWVIKQLLEVLPRGRIATHGVKSTHTRANGTQPLIDPASLPDVGIVGTQALGANYQPDYAGDAANQAGYNFLALEYAGETLFSRVSRRDTALISALAEKMGQSDASTW